ncbi:MAG: hypothetical protein NT023_18980 [Armatimonadetes bacterium]|nr:hypothetical protein [Armatimonadota bacterium]
MSLVPSRLTTAFLGLALLMQMTGCRRSEKPTPSAPVAASPAPLTQEPLPHDLSLAQRRESLLQSLRKRVLGRLEAKEDVERVVRQVRPLIESAVNLPDVQSTLQQMAAEGGISLEEQKKRWADWQEADVLLESGGRSDAVSSAQAVGVAQWLAGTAQGVGLKVNVQESRRLSALITERNYRWAWGKLAGQPSSPSVSTPQRAAEDLPGLKAELELLRAKRREADERYDPAKALTAQTRYLLKLHGRYPSPEWIFQAYHGGEGGVARTLKLYGGRPGFESLYFDLTPKTNLPAFLYLYGRSDDHRYYWWKICVAHEVLDLFRRDRQAFQAEWEGLLPGRSKAVLWYPTAHREALLTSFSVREAVRAGSLKPIQPSADIVFTGEVGEAFLRPEAGGLLYLLLQTYREYGGESPFLLTAAATPQDLLLERRKEFAAKHPPKPNLHPLPPSKPVFVPAGDVAPADFDYLSTGLAFQIKPPVNTTNRRTLDYALSVLSDKNLLWYYKSRETNTLLVIPNPRYRDALSAL